MRRLLALVSLVGCDNVFGIQSLARPDAHPDAFISDRPACPGAFYPPETYDIGTSPYAVLLTDVDGINGIDIVTPNAGDDTISILLNQGNGVFAAAPPLGVGAVSMPIGVVAIQMADDPLIDLAVASAKANAVTLFKGMGNGMFVAQMSYATGVGPAAIAVGRVNGDGLDDVITVNSSGTMTMLVQDGSGGFKSPQTQTVVSQPTHITLADINGDDHPDAIVASATQNTVAIYFNVLTGFNLNPITLSTPSPQSTTAGIVDANTTTDIVAISASGSARVFTGAGNGVFTLGQTLPVGSMAWSASLGMLGGDMRNDLVIARNTSAGGVGVATGNGDGTFAAPQDYPIGSASLGAAIGDLDGVPPLDIVTANLSTSSVSVLLGCQ